MIARDFIFKSVLGDTINTKSLHDKPLIIAYSCGGGGDIKSTESYYNIRDAYGHRIYALRLDTGLMGAEDNWRIDTEVQFNKDAFNKYRQEYCSRVCYVIGKNSRILDKFMITDWKFYLPKYFQEKK
ncbi:MAG: hypothetical protein ACJA2S_002553 [Cyclobacteriaceae bacterium]|jgi:hypothetical protein